MYILFFLPDLTSLDGRRVLPQKPGADATNIKVAQGGFPISSLLQMPVRFILLCMLDVEGETPDFGTVSSLLQSVHSHGLWGGSTDVLPSTVSSARSRFERD